MCGGARVFHTPQLHCDNDDLLPKDMIAPCPLNHAFPLPHYQHKSSIPVPHPQGIFFFMAPVTDIARSSDFLRVCFRCRRSLEPGIDIYMYRGDQAFCSAECRYQQMDVDEQKGRYPCVTACKGDPDHKESKEGVASSATVEIVG